MKLIVLVVASLVSLLAAMNVGTVHPMHQDVVDADLVRAVDELDLSLLAAAAEGRTAYSASQMEMAEVLVAFNHGDVHGDVAPANNEDDSSDDEVEMGMGDNEKISYKAYCQHQKERKQHARDARSLPERNGPDWLRAMKAFGSAKRYTAAINDFALWLDNVPERAKAGVILEKLVVDYFQWYYDQVDYLGNQCNRGTTMRGIQSMFVKYWKHIYRTDFKLVAPAISDMCSMWEKVQPPVTKTEVSSTPSACLDEDT